MTAQWMDGKRLAASMKLEMKVEVSKFIEMAKRPPSLHVILVGEDPASVIYTKNKEKSCNEIGILGKLHRVIKEVSDTDLFNLITKLNEDSTVDGILVQLPLPKHLNKDRILDSINPEKDVDGFHPFNLGYLFVDRPKIIPCTPKGCLKLIDSTGFDIEGKNAVVIGRSIIVGKPISQLLLSRNATVTVAHSKTKNVKEICQQSDILVVAAGKPNMVDGSWIKPGSIVVDVGIHRTEDGKIVGDVRTETCMNVASWITPVPGGVGPMTIACLLENTIFLAQNRFFKGK